MGYPTYDEVRLQSYKQNTGTTIIGDAVTDVALLKGRISTGTKAGTALVLDSSYLYSEGLELRYKVTSWTGIGSSFSSLYLRAEAGVASGSQGIKALEIYTMANATFSVSDLVGAYIEIGMKASGTQTITGGKALELSVAPYTGTGAITITNAVDCLLLTPSGVSSRLDSGNAAKIHGIRLLARDGDGGSTKLGVGLYMGNDTGQSGTRTLTTGINIAIGTTNGIIISGTSTECSLKITNAALTVGDNYSGVRVAVTGAAPHNEYGMAAYFDTTLNGTTAGHIYGVGSWINTGATSPVLTAGHIIVPFEGGVYTGEAQSTARVVFGGQFQAILTGAPASLHAFRINTTQTITALFAAANSDSIGYSAGTGTSGTQLGYIKFAEIVGINSGNPCYIRIYATAT